MNDIDSAIRAVRMHLSDWVADAVEAELARLREENADCKAGHPLHDKYDEKLEAENARLNALVDDLAAGRQHDQDENEQLAQEIDELREVLEDHWDHDDVWCFACHLPIERCSANALKETT